MPGIEELFTPRAGCAPFFHVAYEKVFYQSPIRRLSNQRLSGKDETVYTPGAIGSDEGSSETGVKQTENIAMTVNPTTWTICCVPRLSYRETILPQSRLSAIATRSRTLLSEPAINALEHDQGEVEISYLMTHMLEKL